MREVTFSTVTKRVLTHEGLYFKRPGDVLKAIEILNQEKILSEVLDTEFAVMFEEAQKRKATLEPYRDQLNASKAVCRVIQNKTLARMDEVSERKSLKKAKQWEVLLRMSVAGEVFTELVKNFGKEEAKKRNKIFVRKYSLQQRQIKGEYHFAFGLFFNTQEEFKKAIDVLSRVEGLEGVAISTDIALIAFYLQKTLQDKPVGSFNLLQTAQEVSRGNAMWKWALRDRIKRAVLEEVHPIYSANETYYKKVWSEQFLSGVEYEIFSEALIDTYSPSLRPDLFQFNELEILKVEDQDIVEEQCEKVSTDSTFRPAMTSLRWSY